MKAHRIYVEKYSQFQVEAQSLRAEFNENLSLNLRTLRLINVYDLFGFSDELLDKCRYSVFGEVVTDSVSDECPSKGRNISPWSTSPASSTSVPPAPWTAST